MQRVLHKNHGTALLAITGSGKNINDGSGSDDVESCPHQTRCKSAIYGTITDTTYLPTCKSQYVSESLFINNFVM